MSDKKNFGIGSLFDKAKDDYEAINKTSTELTNARKISVDKIKSNPRQPRLVFNKKDIDELADSIKANGLLNPIGVTKEGDGYIITHGERRYRAARTLGWAKIPATIEENKTNVQKAKAALSENVVRKDLTPIEEAKAFRSLIQNDGLTQAEIAEEYNLSRSAVANKIRLLNLPQKVQTLIIEGKLREGHARQLLNLNTEEEILKTAADIVLNKDTVRSLENKTRIKKGKVPSSFKFNVSINKDLLKNNKFKAKVRISNDKVNFTFDSEEDMRVFLKYIGFIQGE